MPQVSSDCSRVCGQHGKMLVGALVYSTLLYSGAVIVCAGRLPSMLSKKTTTSGFLGKALAQDDKETGPWKTSPVVGVEGSVLFNVQLPRSKMRKKKLFYLFF